MLHQYLWTFGVLVCLLSATERFLSQPRLPSHVTAVPVSPLSPSSAVVFNDISSHFLISLSVTFLLICTVPAQ